MLINTARHEGKSLGELVIETLRWRAQNEEADARSERGIAQLERGEFIEHEQMERRIAHMLRRQ